MEIFSLSFFGFSVDNHDIVRFLPSNF